MKRYIAIVVATAVLALTVTASTARAAVTQVDMLVFYSPQAEAWLGLAGLQKKLDESVAHANATLLRSNSNMELHVVAVLPSPVPQGVDQCSSYRAVRDSSTAKGIRDSYKADTVAVITYGGSGVGCSGMWYSWGPNGTIGSYDAFFAIALNYMGGSSDHFTHEAAGHATVSCEHNPENAAQTTPAYNYGFRLCQTGGFRDVMTYPCSNGVSLSRSPYFSNPQITVNGIVIGTPEGSVDKAADCARVQRELGPKLMAFRGGDVTPPPEPPPPTTPPVPATPTNFAVVLNGSSVALSWSLPDANATSIIVQRAKLNPKNNKWGSYATAATITVPQPSPVAMSYNDAPGRGTYRYRLSAANATGASQPTGVAQISVP